MQTRWIATDRIYRQIIAAPDAEERSRVFREGFGPLFTMLHEAASHVPTPDDPVEAARMWGLLLPENLGEVPEALHRLEAADAWRTAAQALAEGAACFAPYADRIALETVTGWLLLADPAKAEPSNRGYTGFQFPGHVIGVFDSPDDDNLSRLKGLVVHELHHLVRLKLFPWTAAQPYSVADYIVLEGMAESFAAQLYGEQVVGYYVTDIQADELETAWQVVQRGFEAQGDVRAYLFGDHFARRWGFQEVGMPPFGGYAVGYHVVQAYARRTGMTIEEMTFLPAGEIAAGSGYFDSLL